jgi:YbbR domain-containing protein
VILNEAEIANKIQLNVRATQSNISQLTTSISNINASVDLTPIDVAYNAYSSDFLSLRIEVKLPNYINSNAYEILQIIPNKIDIKLDKMISKTFKLSYDIDYKTNDQNEYITLDPILNPQHVTVTGPMTIVENIKLAKVSVDIEDETTDYNTQSEVEFIGMDDHPIKNLTVDTSTIDVLVPIRKSDKIAILQPNIKGTVAKGYTLTSFSYEPKSVSVIGTDEYIDKIKNIEIDPILLNEETDTVTKHIDITEYLSRFNVELRDASNSIITVTINIEKNESKTLTVPTSNLEVIGNISDIVLPDYFSITLEGPLEELNNIVIEDIKGKIDVTELEKGTHLIEIDIGLKDNMKIIDDEKITLEVEKLKEN